MNQKQSANVVSLSNNPQLQNAIEKRYAYMTGSQNQTGSYLIFLPDQASIHPDSTDDFEIIHTKLMTYFYKLLRKQREIMNKSQGCSIDEPKFSLVIDRRKGKWSSVKMLLDVVMKKIPISSSQTLTQTTRPSLPSSASVSINRPLPDDPKKPRTGNLLFKPSLFPEKEGGERNELNRTCCFLPGPKDEGNNNYYYYYFSFPLSPVGFSSSYSQSGVDNKIDSDTTTEHRPPISTLHPSTPPPPTLLLSNEEDRDRFKTGSQVDYFSDSSNRNNNNNNNNKEGVLSNVGEGGNFRSNNNNNNKVVSNDNFGNNNNNNKYGCDNGFDGDNKIIRGSGRSGQGEFRIEKIYLLQPAGIMSGLFRLLSVSLDNNMVEVLSSTFELHKLIRPDKLTHDFNGSFVFSIADWLEDRKLIENLEDQVAETTKSILDFRTSLAEIEYRLTPEIPEKQLLLATQSGDNIPNDEQDPLNKKVGMNDSGSMLRLNDPPSVGDYSNKVIYPLDSPVDCDETGSERGVSGLVENLEIGSKNNSSIGPIEIGLNRSKDDESNESLEGRKSGLGNVKTSEQLSQRRRPEENRSTELRSERVRTEKLSVDCRNKMEGVLGTVGNYLDYFKRINVGEFLSRKVHLEEVTGLRGSLIVWKEGLDGLLVRQELFFDTLFLWYEFVSRIEESRENVSHDLEWLAENGACLTGGNRSRESGSTINDLDFSGLSVSHVVFNDVRLALKLLERREEEMKYNIDFCRSVEQEFLTNWKRANRVGSVYLDQLKERVGLSIWTTENLKTSLDQWKHEFLKCLEIEKELDKRFDWCKSGQEFVNTITEQFDSLSIDNDNNRDVYSLALENCESFSESNALPQLVDNFDLFLAKYIDWSPPPRPLEENVRRIHKSLTNRRSILLNRVNQLKETAGKRITYLDEARQRLVREEEERRDRERREKMEEEISERERKEKDNGEREGGKKNTSISKQDKERKKNGSRNYLGRDKNNLGRGRDIIEASVGGGGKKGGDISGRDSDYEMMKGKEDYNKEDEDYYYNNNDDDDSDDVIVPGKMAGFTSGSGGRKIIQVLASVGGKFAKSKSRESKVKDGSERCDLKMANNLKQLADQLEASKAGHHKKGGGGRAKIVFDSKILNRVVEDMAIAGTNKNGEFLIGSDSVGGRMEKKNRSTKDSTNVDKEDLINLPNNNNNNNNRGLIENRSINSTNEETAKCLPLHTDIVDYDDLEEGDSILISDNSESVLKNGSIGSNQSGTVDNRPNLPSNTVYFKTVVTTGDCSVNDMEKYVPVRPRGEWANIGPVVETGTIRRKKCHVIKELIDTEQTYTNELKSIIEGYYDQYENEEMSVLLPEVLVGKRDALFGNIKEMYRFHSEIFLRDLEKYKNSVRNLAKCFINNKDSFQMYSEYCQNKVNAERLIELAGNNNPFFRECQKRLNHSLPLSAYILKPVQRITKYHLLLKELVRMSCDIEEDSELKRAVICICDVLKYVNNSMHQLSITNFPGSLSDQGRLLMQGPLDVCLERRRDRSSPSLKPSLHRRQVFLYDKSMLLCKKKNPEISSSSGNSAFQTNNAAIVDSTYVFKSCLDTSKVGPLVEFSKGGDERRFELVCQNDLWIFVAPDKQQKQEWTDEIKKVLYQQMDSLRAISKRLMVNSSSGNSRGSIIVLEPACTQQQSTLLLAQQPQHDTDSLVSIGSDDLEMNQSSEA